MKVGVKEYWIISPQNKTVQIFNLNEDDFYSEPIIYSKEDIIKSVIFKDLIIKLSDIFE
ncbi:Uma2 family endonuclease [Anaerosalibacter bizertensis]|uniref:Uma2 family endonuclease n=1 Tax=Anaerosalibacter bizertensis TaxID=932217 RepID=UPI00227B793C|nr:Uma2 family endonuclease [Anaerosalibacter bizertensis]